MGPGILNKTEGPEDRAQSQHEWMPRACFDGICLCELSCLSLVTQPSLGLTQRLLMQESLSLSVSPAIESNLGRVKICWREQCQEPILSSTHEISLKTQYGCVIGVCVGGEDWRMCIHVWTTNVDVGYLPLSFSVSFFEIVSSNLKLTAFCKTSQSESSGVRFFLRSLPPQLRRRLCFLHGYWGCRLLLFALQARHRLSLPSHTFSHLQMLSFQLFLPLAPADSASLCLSSSAQNLSTSTALEPGAFLLSGELGNPFSLSAETGGSLYRSASTNCLPEEPPISPPATYKT